MLLGTSATGDGGKGDDALAGIATAAAGKLRLRQQLRVLRALSLNIRLSWMPASGSGYKQNTRDFLLEPLKRHIRLRIEST